MDYDHELMDFGLGYDTRIMGSWLGLGFGISAVGKSHDAIMIDSWAYGVGL